MKLIKDNKEKYMNTLFISSEIYPYSKSGGLADVAHSLPESLRKKIKLWTITPLYRFIEREKFGIKSTEVKFEYWLAGVCYKFEIYKSKDDEFFLYNDILCEVDELYGTSEQEYENNSLRFGLFSYGVLEAMIKLNLKIDILHLNDWQSSLIALLAKERYKLKQKVILTIHNLAYQGIFDKSIMDILELDWKKCFKPESLEYYDQVNFLKSAIFYSDEITTVSPSYAKEIQTPLFGNGLDELLKQNSHKLTGILNGISYRAFNPKRDKALYKKFSIKHFKDKYKNKEKLLNSFGLTSPNRPLFSFISRFTSQKGIDLLINSLNLFKDLEVNFVILGSGEEEYNQLFKTLQNRYKNIYIKIGYDDHLSRKIYASSDFLLMPSKFEPCGLNQMIAMRYGGIPIVAKTGGLKDTVFDFTDVNENFDKGVGITYQEHNNYWFLHAIAKALSLYGNREKFEQICRNNMKVDNSWKHLAKEYIKIYQ